MLDASWVVNAQRQYMIAPLLMSRGMTTASINALLLQAGESCGLRQGELRGYISGLQTVAALIGSTLWASWFARCSKAKQPRRFFAGSAACILLQNVIMQIALSLP